MPEFHHRKITLEYEISGDGAPFVFLHGMGGSMQQIYSTYNPISGVRLITMNQQGHGRSGADWDTFDFNRLGDDAAALLNHLGIEQAVFAGISMGAGVCLNVALRYPQKVSRLLLIRNAWTDQPMSEPVQTAYHDMGICLENGGVEAFYQTKGWEIVKAPSAYTRIAFLIPFTEEASLKYWQKFLILPHKTPIASADDLKKLQVPVSILACRDDLCHPYEYGEYLAGLIPGAEFTEIPSKDADKDLHKAMINQAIWKLF